MATCGVCGAGTVTSGHTYCAVQDKRNDCYTISTLTSLIASGQGSTVPNAASKLSAAQTRLASVTPSGDGSEPW